MAETVVNENATIWVTASFFDRNSSATTPTTVSYSIHDDIDGTTLSTGTETPGTSVEITVPSSANAIRHGKPYERRKINILATFSTGQHPDEKSWLVKNLGYST